MSPASVEERPQRVLGTEHHAPVDPGIFVPVELAMFTNETSTHDQWKKQPLPSSPRGSFGPTYGELLL